MMRKILSILLCLTMLLSMALPAFAEETVDPGVQPISETTDTTPVPPATEPVPPVTEPDPTVSQDPTTTPETTPSVPVQ